MTITFSKISSQNGSDLIYERSSSSLANPVAANASGNILLSWTKTTTKGDALILAVGTDQHDNAVYTWKFDGVTLPISGSARAGSLNNPFVFPQPIRVKSNVILYVTNNNSVAYPNNGLDPSDQIPFEGMFIGRWA